MKLMLSPTVMILLAATMVQAQAPGGSIGIYADAAGTSNEITVAPQYATVDFYVLAKPNTANLSGGMFGAEFRIKGAPPISQMPLLATPNPAASLALNNPFSDESLPPGSRGGCNFAFGFCATPDAQGFILLYTVSATDLALVTDVFLEVDRRDPPTNPAFPFAHVNACDQFFSAIEVDGLSATINATSIAVEHHQWGAVKSLYR